MGPRVDFLVIFRCPGGGFGAPFGPFGFPWGDLGPHFGAQSGHKSRYRAKKVQKGEAPEQGLQKGKKRPAPGGVPMLTFANTITL